MAAKKIDLELPIASNRADEGFHVTRLSVRDSRRLTEILEAETEPTAAARESKNRHARLIALPRETR